MRHMLAATEAIGGYVSRGRAAFDADPASIPRTLMSSSMSRQRIPVPRE